MDANESALQTYMDKLEVEQQEYEELLQELRDSEPEDYESIIDSHGWGDSDLTEILGDI